MKSCVPGKMAGFTLIELTIVIVLLAILAINAFPRLVQIDDEAKRAQVEYVAGGLASAVQLAMLRHVKDARPGSIDFGGSTIAFQTSSGITTWPVGTSVLAGTQITDAQCANLFNALLHDGPIASTDTSGDYQASTITTSTPGVCVFTPTVTNPFNSGISYNSGSGTVQINN